MIIRQVVGHQENVLLAYSENLITVKAAIQLQLDVGLHWNVITSELHSVIIVSNNTRMSPIFFYCT